MTKTRSELREKCMIILYQIEIMKKNKIEYNIDDLIHDNLEIENEFVKEIVYGVTTEFDKLNELADKYLKNWSIDRLEETGASILRMAIYEIINTDTPNIVIIDEAINLAKQYSDDKVRKMINASLDRLVKENE